jgi:hypothetical protein
MALADVTDARRERGDWNARLKLSRNICNTYGFGALGGSLAEPLLQGGLFTAWNLAGIALGFALHLVALYLAPIGEKHDRS